MNITDLVKDIKNISGYYNFDVVVQQIDEKVWGRYLPSFKTILLNCKTDDNFIDSDIIVWTLCHEVSHYILECKLEEPPKHHCTQFYEIEYELINMYYKGEVPVKVLEYLKEERKHAEEEN